MATRETNTPAYWYVFPKSSDLRTILFQCAPNVLLTPYRMWRLEQSGDTQRQLLLAVEQPLPAQWCTLLRASHIREEQQLLTGEATTTSCLRITLHDAASGTLWGEGWGFPLRQGEHLLAALGFELVPPKTDIAWVLYSLPTHKLRELISDHFTLHNSELRCSPDIEGRRWLWVRRPELYLVLKYKEHEDIDVFQSFPSEKMMFTPWGYRSPLGGRLRFPQGERLLAFALQGSHTSLDTSKWWMASEVITIEELPTITALQPEAGAPQIPVQLRFQTAESIDIPTIWLLEEADAPRQLESLFMDLSPEARAAISLFVAERATTGQHLYLVRDDRPVRTAPLFPTQSATGFVPLLQDDGLHIPKNMRIVPTLPPMVWRKSLQLSREKITLFFPQPNIAEGMRILQAPVQQFAPLEQYASYQIGAHQEQLRALAQASTFEILFDPTSLSPSTEPPRPTTPSPTEATTRPPPVSVPSPHVQPSSATTELHISGREVHTPRLRQLEVQLQSKARKNSPIQPREWIQLASLYQQEHTMQRDPYWLHEALKTLDQVLYLDRCAENAVEIEQQILRLFLQIKPEQSLASRMKRLDQCADTGEVLMMRLAFRCRARLLLDDNHNDAESHLLRQSFYQDLARVDDALMLREHYIYVAGVAQYLDDHELYERARTRYRQLIADGDRLQRELPDILI